MSSLVQSNVSLKSYNTFGVDVSARFFASVATVEDLRAILTAHPNENVWYLGGGSNVLLTKDVDALVVHMNLLGIEIVSEDDASVQLRVQAGENWHNFVQYCLQHNYGGVENLALIPGTVGAAPVQNIGAYGRELKDVFVSCDVLERASGAVRTYSKQECNFGYRSSIFKQAKSGDLAIVSVTLQLTKVDHVLSLEYGAIRDELTKMSVVSPTIQDVAQAVIAIRSSKLPDPAVLGNSGSFFKNPVLSASEFEIFSARFPEAPFFLQDDGGYKVPAGWLVEHAGLRGARSGNVGTYEKQSLVIVNYGGATGYEIWQFAQSVINAVQTKFGIRLEPEVRVM